MAYCVKNMIMRKFKMKIKIYKKKRLQFFYKFRNFRHPKITDTYTCSYFYLDKILSDHNTLSYCCYINK